MNEENIKGPKKAWTARCCVKEASTRACSWICPSLYPKCAGGVVGTSDILVSGALDGPMMTQEVVFEILGRP